MNILVTSSRMPCALDEIRKLGRGGHRVFAVDTFYTAPGSHSRWVTERFAVTPPERDPRGYVLQIDAIARRCETTLIVPCFEEVFYLARHRERLWPRARLFAASFPVLARLHDKRAFVALARALGLATPATDVVTSPRQLRRALRRRERYVARPAWSRGGLEVLANAGPFAGTLRPEACAPTADSPWIVQDYVDGVDLSSFSVARRGHVVAHCTYIQPRTIDRAGGPVFESIVDPEVLGCVRRIVEHTGYHGQISLDFRRGPRGLVVLECNPRPTAGVHLMPGWMLRWGLTATGDGVPFVVPAGLRRLYAPPLLRDALVHPRQLPRDVALLSRGGDVYAEPGDRLPALFQLLSYGLVLLHRLRRQRRERPPPEAACFDGIRWNGQRL